MSINIYWHKLNPSAIIPTKRDEDAGFDIYSIEDEFTLAPHTQHLFSTGLSVAITPGYWLMAFDRGSTGSKGLHVHCGVVDNGYKGEIFICLNNDNPFPVRFTRDPQVTKPTMINNCLLYPFSKAIAQLIPIAQPQAISAECGDDEWNECFAHNSERGDGKLGASGK